MKLPFKPHLLRFSIRTALITLTLFCVWLGVQVNRARVQRHVVDWVHAMGGHVSYEHDYRYAIADINADANYEDFALGPKWLRDFFGEEYFFRIHKITIRSRSAPLTDITTLASARHLKHLKLRHTQMLDLSPLSQLHDLEDLELMETQVSDLSVLRNLTRLQDIRINYAENVTDLTPLAQLNSLESIQIYHAENVTDLSPLAQLTNLKFLRLVKTQVRDLSPLIGLKKLENIRVEGTPVHDIAPLTQLKGLTYLQLSGTEVSDDDIEKLRVALPNCRLDLN